MRLPGPRRRPRPDLEVARGERLLAWTESSVGTVGGTREALYLPGARLPWQEVESAHWDRDTAVLVVRQVGGDEGGRREHVLTVEEPGLLLELVRERVTASVVLERHVPVEGRRGLRVVARRAPSGDRAILWSCDLDEGLDPADPAVRRAAERALAAARAEVEPG